MVHRPLHHRQRTGRRILGDPPIDRPGLEETNQDRERPFPVDFTEINDLLVSDVVDDDPGKFHLNEHAKGSIVAGKQSRAQHCGLEL